MKPSLVFDYLIRSAWAFSTAAEHSAMQMRMCNSFLSQRV